MAQKPTAKKTVAEDPRHTQALQSYEAGLRAMMDHDLATLNKKLNANTSLLQALRITQGDHTRMLTRMETDIAELKTGAAKTVIALQIIMGKLDDLLGR